MFVLPTRIAPAARRRATAVASFAPISSGRSSEASRPGSPATTIASLTVNGTPASGPCGRPAAAARARVDVEDHDRVELAVALLEASQVPVEHLRRAHRAGAHRFRDLCDEQAVMLHIAL